MDIKGTRYYILCECGGRSAELTKDGQVCVYVTKRAAQQDAAYMKRLMEGGARVTYSVKAAR